MAFFTSKLLTPLLQIVVLCLLLLVCIVAVTSRWSLMEAHSEARPFQLRDGIYSLEQPLDVSLSPPVQIERGRLHFADGQSATSALLRRLLPEGWAQMFMAEKLDEMSLIDGELLIDLRPAAVAAGQKGRDEGGMPQLLSAALLKSDLADVHLKNCRIRLIRADAGPLDLLVKTARLSVDIEDGAFESKGVIDISGREVGFQFSSAMISEASRPARYRLALYLSHEEISARFDGIAALDGGGQLEGAFRSQFADIALLEQLLGIHPAAEGEDVAAPVGRDENDPPGGAAPKAALADPLPFSLAGALDWRGQAGKLTGLSLVVGSSRATGTLRLKSLKGRQLISGSLAFDQLAMLLPDIGLNEPAGEEAGPASGHESGSESGRPAPVIFSHEYLDGVMGRFLQRLYPMITRYEADLRFSAEVLELGPMKMKDAGFSLFQKDGEVIVDLAETSVFEGTASGHLKIDTKYPKPRWHINLNFREIAPEAFSEIFGQAPLITGLGYMQLNLTSYGDKSTEIYQNMQGALSFRSLQGGKLALDLESLNQAQGARPLTIFQQLVAGETEFQSLAGEGHFKNGALVADFFEITTPRMHYTGLGRLSLSEALHDWHIASWAAVTKSARKAEADTESGAQPSESPYKLIMCSSINGSWAAPRVEKHSAAELALLRTDCKASYKTQPERSKYDYIAPLDKAG